MTTATMATGTRTTRTAAESELRAAARRRGLTMKELAALMGVSAGYLSQIANGGRPWTPKMREKVAAVLERSPDRGPSTARAASSPARAASSGSAHAPWA